MNSRSLLQKAICLVTILALASSQFTTLTSAAQDSLYAWADANSDLSEHESFKADIDAASEWRIMSATGDGTGGTGIDGTGTTGTTGENGDGWTVAQCRSAGTSTMAACSVDQSLRCSLECGFVYSDFYTNCILERVIDGASYGFSSSEYSDFYSICSSCTSQDTQEFMNACDITLASGSSIIASRFVYPTNINACSDECGTVSSVFIPTCIMPSFPTEVPANLTAYDSLCVITVPGAVDTLFTVAASDTSISLSWGAIHGTGTTVSYVLERETTTGSVAIYTGTNTNFLDTGLQANTTYSYRVMAFNVAGNSTFTEFVSQTTLLGAPAAPGDVVVEPGLDFIMASWTPVTVDDSVVYYQVYLNEVPVWFGTDVETTLSSLSAATYYNISVRASTLGSAFSAAATVTAKTLDSVPFGLSFLPTASQTVTASSITLFWNVPQFCGGVTRCSDVVYYITTNASACALDGTAPVVAVRGGRTNLTFSAVTYTTTYFFTIRAENSVGNSTASATLYLTTPATIPNAPSQLVIAQVTDSFLNLTWSTNATDGGSRILGADILVMMSSTGSSTTYQVNFWVGSYLISNLLSNTSYFVKIRTRNDVGVSDWATNANLTVVTKLPAPQVLSYVAASNDGVTNSMQLYIYFDTFLNVNALPVNNQSAIDALFTFVPAIPLGNYNGSWGTNGTGNFLAISFPVDAPNTPNAKFALGFAYITFNVLNIGLGNTAAISYSYKSPVLSGSFFNGVTNVFTDEVYSTVRVLQDSVNNTFGNITPYSGDGNLTAFESFSLVFSVLGSGSLSLAVPSDINVTVVNSNGVITFSGVTMDSLVRIASYVRYSTKLYSLENDAIAIRANGNNAAVQTVIPIAITPVPHLPQIQVSNVAPNLIIGGSVQIGAYQFSDVDDIDGTAMYYLQVAVSSAASSTAYLVVSQIPIAILPLGSTVPNTQFRTLTASGTLAALADFANNDVRYYDDSIMSSSDIAQVTVRLSEGADVNSTFAQVSQSFTPVCAGAVAPSMSSAVFSSDYTSIQVVFSAPVDMTSISSASCTNYFITSVVGRMGTAPLCRFTDSRTLSVLLGANALVMPGESLTLADSNVIRRCSTSAVASGSVVVASPATSVAPTVSVTGIPIIGLCDDISLYTSIANNAGRPVSYSWVANVSAVLPFLPASGASASMLSISNQNLAPGTYYQFTVTIKDFLNRTALASFTVLKSEDRIPTVQVQGSTSLTQFASDTIVVQVVPVLNTCLSAAERQMDFTWSLRNSTGASVTIARNGSPTVSIASNTLIADGSPYSLMLLTSMTTNPALYTTTQYTINIVPTPLQVLISGGASRTQSKSAPLSVSAVVSDYDRSSAAVTYVWQCTTSSGAACADATSSTTLTFASVSTITVNANTLAAGAYTFSVSASKPGRAAVSALTIVNLVAASIPTVSVSTTTLQISATDSLRLTSLVSDSSSTSFTYSWSVMAGDLVLSQVARYTQDGRSITINPNNSASIFAAGTTYSFRLSVTNSNNLTGSADISVTVRTPPAGGSISVTPSTGVALSTNFQWSTSGWSSSNTPLTYQFFTVQNGVYRQQSSGSIIGSGKLGGASGSTQFVVRACDRFGSCAEASTSITLTAATASTSQIQSLIDDAVTTASQTSDVSVLLTLISNIISSYGFSAPSRRLLQTSDIYTAIQGVLANPSVLSLVAVYTNKVAVFNTVQQYSQALQVSGTGVREFGAGAEIIQSSLQNYATGLSGTCDSVTPTDCAARRSTLNAAADAVSSAITALPALTAVAASEDVGSQYVQLVQLLNNLYASSVLSTVGDLIQPAATDDFTDYIRRDASTDDAVSGTVQFPAASLASAVDSSNVAVTGPIASVISVLASRLVSTFYPLANIVYVDRQTASGSQLSFSGNVTTAVVTIQYSQLSCPSSICVPQCKFSANPANLTWTVTATMSTPTLVSGTTYQVTCTVQSDTNGVVALAPQILAGPSDDSSDNSLALGLGIGLGVGGGLIIIAALAYFFIVRKSQTVVPQSSKSEPLTSNV